MNRSYKNRSKSKQFCQIATDVQFVMNGGNPAKPIRKRFDDETIAFLLALKWWDWPIEKIRMNLKSIMNTDFEALKQIKNE